MKKIILIFCFITSLGFTQIEEEHSISYYNQLANNQNINNYLKIDAIIEWFKNEVTTIETVNVKQNNYIIVTYYFKTDGITTATLEIKFKENEIIYTEICLKMMINGTDRTYINEDAKKIMIMLLSKNEDFNYHSK